MARVFMIISLVACLVSVAYAASGTATYYTPPYVRKCFFFFYTSSKDVSRCMKYLLVKLYIVSSNVLFFLFCNSVTASSCYGYQDNGVMIAAASDVIWNNRAACGRNYRVTCTGPTNQGVPQPCRGSVVVKIVDYCPPGCAGTIDLSQEAFARIADPNAGKVRIDYQQV
ncbi:OLC1v1035341C1 [Oldenlandia corymbosa var. corymbosa]|uniref:OLC1v1035341C1 n=1 Tax=Oldenlandia corymbosa var. corymbosa TaxID=529605 RepID=A0AAV1CSQ4_OLDCO|nr:OLC1v1035341C1 [Oldenlandia corymbosa var. corymbosa]